MESLGGATNALGGRGPRGTASDRAVCGDPLHQRSKIYEHSWGGGGYRQWDAFRSSPIFRTRIYAAMSSTGFDPPSESRFHPDLKTVIYRDVMECHKRPHLNRAHLSNGLSAALFPWPVTTTRTPQAERRLSTSDSCWSCCLLWALAIQMHRPRFLAIRHLWSVTRTDCLCTGGCRCRRGPWMQCSSSPVDMSKGPFTIPRTRPAGPRFAWPDDCRSRGYRQRALERAARQPAATDLLKLTLSLLAVSQNTACFFGPVWNLSEHQHTRLP